MAPTKQSRTLNTENDLKNHIESLIALEPRFAQIHTRVGTPPLRRVPISLESLLSIVTDQMLSRHAANAIWQRTLSLLDPLAPETILATDEQALRGVGQSRAKIKTFRAIASAMLDGSLDLNSLPEQNDELVISTLKQLPGIGDWTANIVLLTCLGRPDAFPAADVALQSATQSAFELDTRPATHELIALAQSWRPHRATAARLLWSWYRLLAL